MKLPRPILAFLLLVTGMWAQENWQPRVSGTTVNLWGIAYGNGLWVAVGDPGTILTSLIKHVDVAVATGFESTARTLFWAVRSCRI